MKIRIMLWLTAMLASLGPITTHAALITALTLDNQLLTFDSNSPNMIQSTVSVSGLGDSVLQDIDYRPATGQLYGVGVNAGGQGAIFQIDGDTGAATFVSLTGAPFTPTGNLGIDFNPVPDALRVDTTADQNYRSTFATPTVNVNADGTLAYAGGDLNAGADPRITTLGYTNSFAGAMTTTLYGIDSNLNILVRQAPPNAGTLNTVGALGFNVSSDSGFDISADNQAFLADLDQLYSVNLATGLATLLGQIGSGSPDIIGLAVVATPEPSIVMLLGSGLAGLAFFRRKTQRKAI